MCLPWSLSRPCLAPARPSAGWAVWRRVPEPGGGGGGGGAGWTQLELGELGRRVGWGVQVGVQGEPEPQAKGGGADGPSYGSQDTLAQGPQPQHSHTKGVGE